VLHSWKLRVIGHIKWLLIPACVHLLARIIVPIIPRYLERLLISISTTVVQFTSPILVIIKILAVPSWQYRLLLLHHLIEIAIAIAKVVIISTVTLSVSVDLSVLTLSVTVVVIVATVTCVVVICERLLVRHLFYLNSLS
jgi:hypothetical protein